MPERPMDPEPADADARAALEHAGDRLLSELSAMRGNVDSDEGAALDPKAKRALAGCAKSFLDDLESRRRAMGEKEPRPRRAAVRWMRVAAVGVAAGGVALAAAAYDAGRGGRMPSLPRVVNIGDLANVNLSEQEITGAETTVPEPGTALLAIAGASWIVVLRRRRPGVR